MASGLGVNTIITGKVSKGFGLKLRVLSGADGSLIKEVDVKGGALAKLKSNIGKSGASSVAGALGKSAKSAPTDDDDKKDAAPAEEAKEEEKPAAEAEASASTASSDNDGGLSPLDITAGLRPLHRTFTFHQTIADVRPNGGFYPLLKYELPLGPALFIDLNWYPASHFMKGPAEYVGITGGFEKGFATQSVYREGVPGEQQTLRTNSQAFYVGGRFRFPIGDHLLGAAATFGQHTFALLGDENSPTGPLVPDVTYTYVKAGVNGMFRFGDFLVGAHVGKRFVFSTGGLEKEWFPHTKTQSLEAGGLVGYRLVSMLDLVAGFDWLRYAFDFNPNPTRNYVARSFVAGGAVDEYLSGYIAFRFHVPGKGEPAPSSE
jgi:hypothetical protein